MGALCGHTSSRSERKTPAKTITRSDTQSHFSPGWNFGDPQGFGQQHVLRVQSQHLGGTESLHKHQADDGQGRAVVKSWNTTLYRSTVLSDLAALFHGLFPTLLFWPAMRPL